MTTKIKMYGKFVVWLLKKAFGNAGNHFVRTKEIIAGDWHFAFVIMLFGAVFASLGVAGMLALMDQDISPLGPNQTAYVLAIGIEATFFLVAIVSVLYDKFIADYEQTFDILKK